MNHEERPPEACWVRLAPMISGLIVILVGWGVSVETRLGNISAIQSERTLKLVAIESRIADIAKAAYDPAPRPETKVQLDAMEVDHSRMEQRIDRLEERFNNFHQFLLQTRPPALPSLKRGEVPFRVEDRG